MSKCAWLKKLLGLNEKCCCHEEIPKVAENTVEPVMSENVEGTETKIEETPTETPVQ